MQDQARKESEPNQANTLPPDQKPPRTYGEILAGVSFNPSNDPNVDTVKRLCAQLGDLVHGHYHSKETSGLLETQIYNHAVGELLSAQMAIVKLLTLKY